MAPLKSSECTGSWVLCTLVRTTNYKFFNQFKAEL